MVATELLDMKGIERPGHLHHFLDAVLYAHNAPNSRHAVGHRSAGAFSLSHTNLHCYSPLLLFEGMRLRVGAIQ